MNIKAAVLEVKLKMDTAFKMSPQLLCSINKQDKKLSAAVICSNEADPVFAPGDLQVVLLHLHQSRPLTLHSTFSAGPRSLRHRRCPSRSIK